jgi:hypothetical protein
LIVNHPERLAALFRRAILVQQEIGESVDAGQRAAHSVHCRPHEPRIDRLNPFALPVHRVQLALSPQRESSQQLLRALVESTPSCIHHANHRRGEPRRSLEAA